MRINSHKVTLSHGRIYCKDQELKEELRSIHDNYQRSGHVPNIEFAIAQEIVDLLPCRDLEWIDDQEFDPNVIY